MSERTVWCRACRIAWSATIADAGIGAVTPKAQAVRCPQCRCHRKVALTGDDRTFRREHPEVRWKALQ